ncbi:MAG: hypothetical protein H0V25_03020 [Solirubrobacterales bacterium]|nr:hypothetical protein [Solirubrobacterales bacterium]
MRRNWLEPLTGVVFVVLIFIAFGIGGEPPDHNASVEEIVSHYADNKDSIFAGAFISTLALAFLIFFANYLRRALNVAGEAVLSATVLVGASIMAVGLAIDSTILLTLADSADDLEAGSAQALQALYDNDFLPIALGTVVFLISAGLSILRTGVVPRWLGWVAVALAVIGLTPLGFFAFLGSGIWILVASAVLTLQARRGDARPAAAA